MSLLLPKISIILPCFESVNELDRTLNSVAMQDYSAIELIVIDGGSRDGTRQYLADNAQRFRINHWVSEPDTGISDAFNKGIRAASGEYLYFIGAGDSLCSATVITEMLAGVNPEEDMLIAGKVCRYIRGKQHVWPRKLPTVFDPKQLLYSMAIPHQGLIMHQRYFKTFGLFDCSLRYAMDYELLLRAWNQFPKVVLKPVIVAEWVSGGVGADNTVAVYQEYLKIKAMHKVAPKWWLKGLFYWHCSRWQVKRLLTSSTE